jgi:hypothetical protein
MSFKGLDRSKVRFYPLAKRENRVNISEDKVKPGDCPKALSDSVTNTIEVTAERIRKAREADKPVIMAFGAHTIKNGLGPVLIHLIEKGWVTHLATNGAGIIHDWEFSYLGESSENVRENVEKGQFGAWEETGYFLNLAILLGAYQGLGYGESVGKMIVEEKLDIPSSESLRDKIADQLDDREVSPNVASAADLLRSIQVNHLEPGEVKIPHEFKEYSPQAAAYELGVPFTAHPMFGHDIIYLHPMNHGAAIGRTALRDFLTFADSVKEIDGGVYLSIGSAVMSPMIFEKSFSMAQNLSLQDGNRIENHYICVVDLQESTWDWSKGEPPEDHPDYYLRFYKTFYRMGGELRYVSADNRDFLLALCKELD